MQETFLNTLKSNMLCEEIIFLFVWNYRKTSNTRRTLVGNKIPDQPDVQ